ncbi:MAG: flagellar motor switch protein FliG [Alphaproteobacteria bacterium]|nr:flagellar motor switch protein FliG [Alphaproteobacteria bacterium]
MVAKDDYRKLTGIQKTAIFMMSISEENATRLFGMMDDEEIKEVSQTMAALGHVSSDVVERLFVEYTDQMNAAGVVIGTYDSTERLLLKALGKERVAAIMEDIRGPAGRTTWDKLGNVSEEVLATYLKNEYPQTVSLVLSKLKPDHAARVLSVMPDELGMEVIMRMLSMEAVKKEVLDGVEKTLRQEFMSNLAKTQRRDSFEMMAEIFNNFDRNTETRFMGQLENRDAEAADKVRSLMFTFDDLIKIDPVGIQQLLRNVDKDKLGIALKGANEGIKDLFFSNMSERAAKILKEDMESMGPVRLKDVDESQMYIVQIAKEMAARGEIIIADASGEDQLVY